MSFKIYPYMKGSASVKKLKELLDGQIIKLKDSHYRYRDTHEIINWGNSRRPSWMTTDVPVLNSPEAVAIASNKLETFTALENADVPTVTWLDLKEAAEELLQEGHKIFVRHSLTGHSGEGIEVIEPNGNHVIGRLEDIAFELGEMGLEELAADVLTESLQITPQELPDAPLYTLGVQNHGEYRVHVFDGEVILYQKKSRRVSEDGEVDIAEGEDADVRNLASNWVYRTGNLRRLERVEELAVNAIQALGLDFGAVDIIKDENGDVYVLEVNSAPGLGNEDTQEAYRRAFSGEEPQLPEQEEED